MTWIYLTRALWTVILLLLSFHASAAPLEKPSAASFYIPTIPYVHQNPNHPLTMFGGHLSADPNITRASSTDITSHLYFFMVKNRRTADKERIVFWFNGGPGCSSFDGAMMEVGPWRWDGKSEHDFYVKEGGWEEYTTMVFVDQPAGTGFSYTSTDKYVHTMDIAQAQLIEFLKNFYEVFPEYKNVDTYLAGESFAGQWIPYYADAILSSTLNIPLRGAAIGNGWIDSKVQYPAYLDYVTKTGLFEENSANWKEVKKVTDECISEIEKTKGNPMVINKCQLVLHTIMQIKTHTVKSDKMCINIYDIRLEDTSPACGMNWPPEMPQITNFLGRPEVVSALHASAHPGGWVECRPDVHTAFQESKLESAITVMPRVLSKIPILIFAGDQDLICNYIGLENMIKALNWNGETGLGTVQTQSWTVNAVPAGTWVTSRNLTYVKIFNASHMAPFDVPHVTHDMMLRFMDVNFTAIVDGSAKIPSTIGTITKPIFVEEHNATPTNVVPAKTPEQDKAMWEAYYNAGSAALVLVLVFLLIGTFVWCRVRRNRVQLPTTRVEESIPLTSSMRENGSDEDDISRNRKGKQRSDGESQSEPTIFEVGDSDEEDYKHSSTRK
ncbi:pheromone-processing carboxypeptidase KEX1 [Pholiota conissans]|uniref:Pheromone-processing carboxypeptidase KEX1 n=1 Tax=Pholiota conissans TaxID=109636 RepID=A0A9P5Z773_9AGAR|nr:pheromone-processing carboxypeptidase KEX1 [Pholiota conissans]